MFFSSSFTVKLSFRNVPAIAGNLSLAPQLALKTAVEQSEVKKIAFFYFIEGKIENC